MTIGIQEVKVGDEISACGHVYKVAKVLFQDVWMGYDDRVGANRDERRLMYDVEFLDSKGGYHHWKSNLDGGHIIRA